MKSLAAFLLSLLCVAPLAEAQSRRDRVAPNLLRTPAQAIPGAGPRPFAPWLPSAAARTALGANVILTGCPEPNSVCGYVQVPLDRTRPNETKLSVYFEQYFHSNPGPAVSAIMVNGGGPGFATTDGRDYYQFGLFAANMDAHDLLLVDERGRGLSGAIDCEELQHGGADFATAEKDCAAQLGAAASRYGSGDIAEDMNDVRTALGYNLIDYLGLSYGGADAIAFATRYPAHVRSLVLDSPVGPPTVNPFSARQAFVTHSIPLVLTKLCARSPLCAPDHPNPSAELSALIQSVRARPVEGDSHDASGNLIHVKVDERALLDFALYQTALNGNYTTQNEVLAAYASLKQGDAAPLLRLGAEGFFTIDQNDWGDPTIFSLGALYATLCSDVGVPWDWSDGVSDRVEAHNRYVANLPDDYYAPFSKSVGRDVRFSRQGMQCFWWQKPTHSSPMVKPDALYPAVPTLVLAGDIDDQVPAAANQAVAALFPNSTFVLVANSRHGTTGTQCGTDLANRMIETLSPGDTSCANTPEFIWPAVGRFPLFAKDARAATVNPTGVNQVGLSERKVASVAVADLVDALHRSFLGSGTGVGLRGGTFQTSDLTNYTIVNSMFSSDVVVNGTVIWGADNSVVGDLVISGSGTSGGSLHVTGFWLVGGPLGNFQISGRLGGKNVALLVPEG
jgi:pimeloyl-ACP methyl ester carboxylesterase